MNGLTQDIDKAHAVARRTALRGVWWGCRLCVSMLLVACSSGDGVSIGDGQDADPVVVDFPIAYVQANRYR